MERRNVEQGTGFSFNNDETGASRPSANRMESGGASGSGREPAIRESSPTRDPWLTFPGQGGSRFL